MRHKNASVAKMFSSIPLNISFRRGLVGQNLVLWHNLVSRIAHIQLNDREDTFRWNLHQHGLFSVHSMYTALISNGNVIHNKTLWKLRAPLKIKIFMWYLKRVVLTKDNLARRNWNGSKSCVFCSSNETIQHLFFDCHFAKFMWRAVQFAFGVNNPFSVDHMFHDWLHGVPIKTKRMYLVGASALCWALWLSQNDTVFDKHSMKTYMQVLFRGTHWLRDRAQLQRREEDTIIIMEACRSLQTMVMQVFANHGWRFSNRIVV